MEPMYRGTPFSPRTTLADSIGAADTIIPVADVSVFPDPPNYATIGIDEDGETISYAAKTDRALSGCTRGVEGAPKSWASGSVIARNFTAKDLESLQKNLRKIVNDAPFVSAGSAQALTDAQKEQARVNIGASHIRVESTNIGGDTVIQVVVTDANGTVSRFNPKGSDGGVWVPEYNEDTGVIDWEYHKASDFYPVPSPVPTGIPVPNTAAVGQTIVVSEVDAEGKPTKWEAAEFPAGGGGEEWELIVDYTVPETVNGLTIDKDLNGNPFELKRWRVITAYFPVEGETTVHATQIGFTSVSAWGHCLYAAMPAPTASETASISIAVCGVLGDIQFLEHFSGSQNNTNAAFNIIVQHPPTTQGRRMNEQGEFVSAGTTGNATCIKICGYQAGCVHAGSIVKMWGVRA